jgi:acetyl-CoA acetyltransferase
MLDAVICEPVRTAVGRFGGALRSVPAADLGAQALRGLLDRTGMRYGLATMCIGGGQGLAAVFERIA